LAWERELSALKERLTLVFRPRELKETGAGRFENCLVGVFLAYARLMRAASARG
jgi:hypothetical protein